MSQPNCFESLTLHPLILKAVQESGYPTPTLVQAQAIPALLQGADLLVSSPTGSGKTAAFMLPALHKLARPAARAGRGPRLLVLSPTRELAAQITAAAQKYGRHLPRINVASVVGGMPYPAQNRLLSKPLEILVATPGRLIDQLERGRVDFSRLEMLVLDEADRMLDMGFIEAVERVAAATPKTRQTLLFSATLDDRIAKLARNLLRQPVRIETTSMQTGHEHIEQRLHYVDDLAHKNRLLDHLLRADELKQAIVFTATKRDAGTVAEDLSDQGHSAAALHGDMNQGARHRTLTSLRNGRLRVLVATDVASRGIDVPGVTHVINYDLPRSAEDYVHRIGRTGRAGNQGTAILLASPRDGLQLKRIEHFTGQAIAAHIVVGFEPRIKPRSLAKPRPDSIQELAGGRAENTRHSSVRSRANTGTSFGADRPRWR